jgi:hypothetical protein
MNAWHWLVNRFALEQRILELESGRLEHHVRHEDHAVLSDERDGLVRRLKEAEDDVSRLKKALDVERDAVGAARGWVLSSCDLAEPPPGALRLDT